MEADASNLLSQLMAQLKQPDEQDQGGWWYTLYPSHTNASGAIPVEVRMLHDFLYVGQAIGSELSASNQALMVDFFMRELRTPLFVRAMSQLDPSANVTGSRRADHNQYGSWDGWAGGSVTALVELGRGDLALQLVRDLGQNLATGPFGTTISTPQRFPFAVPTSVTLILFVRMCVDRHHFCSPGQAHRVFGNGTTRAGHMVRPARKDQSWMAVCAGYIADGVVRGLFGFMPSLMVGGSSMPQLRHANVSRGFEGALRHVRYRGRLFTLTSNASGLYVDAEGSDV